MNTTPQSQTSELNADDPRFGAALAVRTARQIADAVTNDQLGRPTPCSDYDVGQLIRHIALTMRRLAELGDAAAAGTVDQIPWLEQLDDSFADGEHPQTLEQLGHAIRNAWHDPARLGIECALPWATVPGAAVVGMYASEIFTHAWDLAVATGQRIDWPNEVVGPLADAGEMFIAAEGRDDPMTPFGPVVEWPADAPPIERMVSWVGRDPAAWPSAAA